MREKEAEQGRWVRERETIWHEGISGIIFFINIRFQPDLQGRHLGAGFLGREVP